MTSCRHFGRLVGLFAPTCLVVLTFAQPARAQRLEWVRQLGTSDSDSASGVSANSLGNIYISGRTQGSLGGSSAGDWDAFLSKYDAAGNVLWIRQLGTEYYDWSSDVSADELGNVYITGSTQGNLGGPIYEFARDAFASKFDTAGILLWTRQSGGVPYEFEYGEAVSADPLGNVYMAATSIDRGSYAFLSKYDVAGIRSWTRVILAFPDNIVVSGEQGHAVSADGLGNAYIVGDTPANLGGPNAGGVDAFVSKYDAAGKLLWARQLGTSDSDSSSGVSTDGLGNVYVTGSTRGDLGGHNAGDSDAFVTKYNASGNHLWTRLFGTSGADTVAGVSADGLGGVYISGTTGGSLGAPNAGADDIFVTKFSAAGDLLWTRQFGTGADDWSTGVSADGLGNVYISGYTDGSLGGPNAGESDAFLAKFSIPEPSALAMVAPGAVVLWRRRRPSIPPAAGAVRSSA